MLHQIAGAAKAWAEIARPNLISGIADVQEGRLQMTLPQLLRQLRSDNINLREANARITSDNYFMVDVDGITFFAILDEGNFNEFVGALNEEEPYYNEKASVFNDDDTYED